MSRRRKIILDIFIVLTLLFIWGNSVLSVDQSNAISDAVKRWVETFVSLPSDSSGGVVTGTFIIRKIAHVTEFFVLSVFVAARFKSDHYRFWTVTTFFTSAVAAAIDETIQFFSGRGSRVTDVLIDLIGVVAAILIMTLIFALMKRRHRKNDGGPESDAAV